MKTKTVSVIGLDYIFRGSYYVSNL